MSRCGNYHDNAVAESFFQLLKCKRIRRHIYATRDQDRAEIFDHILPTEVAKMNNSLGNRKPGRLDYLLSLEPGTELTIFNRQVGPWLAPSLGNISRPFNTLATEIRVPAIDGTFTHESAFPISGLSIERSPTAKQRNCRVHVRLSFKNTITLNSDADMTDLSQYLGHFKEARTTGFEIDASCLVDVALTTNINQNMLPILREESSDDLVINGPSGKRLEIAFFQIPQ